MKNERNEPVSEIEAAIAGLYGGRFDDFVRRRDVLAKELRAAGKREAASTVKSLRKPSRVAWSLDQVAISNHQAISNLDTALAETLNAHSAGGDVRSAIARLRSVARDFADQGMRAADGAGLNVESSVLVNAVFAVLGTPDSLDQLRRGILADVPESGSIDFLASLPTPPVVTAPITPAKPRRAANPRKVILQEFVTLDGFVADSGNSVDFIPSATQAHEAFGQRQLRFMDSIDAILLGRKTYEMFADYWPNVTSGDEKPFADKLNAIPKIVFSKTLKHAPWRGWDDASIVRASAAQEVARLKQESGKDMVIWGSISLAQSLIDEDLIDEFQLIVCPVVLGSGRSLFHERVDPPQLRLRVSQSFDSGIVLLAYAAEKQDAVVD